MDLPTYTNIWRIEKRLYKLYDFRLPAPLPINWIAVFTGITVPYILLLVAIGLPFNHNLVWLYVLPPGVLTWLTTRPVIESKRLPELLESQIRYLAEPRVWCRMAPLTEKDHVLVTARVWHSHRVSRQRAASMVTLLERGSLARHKPAVPLRPAQAPAPGAWPAAPVAQDLVAVVQGSVVPPPLPARQAVRHPAMLGLAPLRPAAAPVLATLPEHAAPTPVPVVPEWPGRVDPASPAGPGAGDRGTGVPADAATASAPPAGPAPEAPPVPVRARGTSGGWPRIEVAHGGPPNRSLPPGGPARAWPMVGPSRPLQPAPARPAPSPSPPQPAAPAQAQPAQAPPAAAATAGKAAEPAAAEVAGAPVVQVTSATSAVEAAPAALQAPAPPALPVASRTPAPAPAPSAPARERSLPSIERALSGPSRERNLSWHTKVKVVAGAAPGPGARDQEALDRARARLPLRGPKRVLMLGCTSGAGQTVTALMAGHILASLREEPVAAVDLQDGTLSSYAAPAAMVREVLDGAQPQGQPSAPPDGLHPNTRAGGQRAIEHARLDVIASDDPLRDGDERRLAEHLGRHYPLTILDPGATGLTRLLKITDQLVIVAPASVEAAGALADTRDWLDAHGFGDLAMHSVTLLNGVSRRSLPDVEAAEAVARGRCRAIVRIPWDDMLPVGVSGPSTLHPQTRIAYTALAGVLVAGMAAAPVRRPR